MRCQTFYFGKWTKWVYPPLFQTEVGGGKMQTSSPPVNTPNRSQSNPDDMITLPRPIQSVGINLHDISGTSTGQTLPRERWAPPGTHFCPTIWWVYPLSATIFILHPLLLSTFHPLLPEIYPLLTTLRPSKGSLKRQSLLQTWCGSAPRRGPLFDPQKAASNVSHCCRPGVGLRPAADHPQMVTTPGVLDPADPRARSLQLLLDISDKNGRKNGQ